MEENKNSNPNGSLLIEHLMRQYINGLDIKTICENFLNRINADTDPAHKKANEERKRVLNNCITLFDNPETQAQIEHIKQSEEFDDLFSLMKKIITEFHLEIFGANKRSIAEYILSKYINGDDMNALGSRILQQISEDSNPEHAEENKECEKILQNILKLLQDPGVKKDIENIRQSENITGNSSFIQRIKLEYFEQIFEKDKRTYDMSNKYIPMSVATRKEPYGKERKIMEFRHVINDPITFVEDDYGDNFTFEKVGRLAYQSQSSGKRFVDKYKIYKNMELLCEVFTRLNPSQLLSNEPYRRAVIRELLSARNIEASKLNSGYIGEIQPPEFSDEKAPIGKQIEIEELFSSLYKYGYSALYDFVFDYNIFSAVKDFQQEQQQSTGTTNKKNAGR